MVKFIILEKVIASNSKKLDMESLGKSCIDNFKAGNYQEFMIPESSSESIGDVHIYEPLLVASYGQYIQLTNMTDSSKTTLDLFSSVLHMVKSGNKLLVSCALNRLCMINLNDKSIEGFININSRAKLITIDDSGIVHLVNDEGKISTLNLNSILSRALAPKDVIRGPFGSLIKSDYYIKAPIPDINTKLKDPDLFEHLVIDEKPHLILGNKETLQVYSLDDGNYTGSSQKRMEDLIPEELFLSSKIINGELYIATSNQIHCFSLPSFESKAKYASKFPTDFCVINDQPSSPAIVTLSLYGATVSDGLKSTTLFERVSFSRVVFDGQHLAFIDSSSIKVF